MPDAESCHSCERAITVSQASFVQVQLRITQTAKFLCRCDVTNHYSIIAIHPANLQSSKHPTIQIGDGGMRVAIEFTSGFRPAMCEAKRCKHDP